MDGDGRRGTATHRRTAPHEDGRGVTTGEITIPDHVTRDFAEPDEQPSESENAGEAAQEAR